MTSTRAGPAAIASHFVVVGEMFSKVDDRYAEYALSLFRQFGLQLLIVALWTPRPGSPSHTWSAFHVVKTSRRTNRRSSA